MSHVSTGLKIFAYFVERKRPIIYSTITGLLLGIGIAFLLTPKYSSTTSVLITKSKGASSIFQTMDPSQGLFAGNLLKNPNDLYLELIDSTRLLDKVIAENNLQKRYESKSLEGTEKMLRSRTSVTLKRGNIISVTVVDRDRKEAPKIALSMVQALRELVAELDNEEATFRFSFYQKKLDLARQQLKDSEDAVVKFRRKNGQLPVQAQVETAGRLSYGVIERLADNQARLTQAKQFLTPESMEYKKLEAERDALKSQLNGYHSNQRNSVDGYYGSVGSLPDLERNFASLLRDYRNNEQIYLLLAQQLEAAALDKDKGATVIQIVEIPRPAERKSAPKRGAIIATMALFGMFGSMLYLWLRDKMTHELASNAESRDAFLRIKKELTLFEK